MAEEQNANLGADNGAVDMQNQNGNQGEQAQVETKTLTTEELSKLLTSEGDKRVEQALKTFKEKELPNLLTKAKTEAEQLAKMTADQKAEQERKQADEQFNRRMAELTKRELKIEAHKILSDKGLPVEFLEIVPYSSADDCNAGIEIIDKVWRIAVEKGVNERLKAAPPPKLPHGDTGASKTITELMKEANAHPERLPQILAQVEAINRKQDK